MTAVSGNLQNLPSFNALISGGDSDLMANSENAEPPLKTQRVEDSLGIQAVPFGPSLPIQASLSSDISRSDMASILQTTMQSFISMQTELMKQQLTPIMKLAEALQKTSVHTDPVITAATRSTDAKTVKVLPPEVWSKLEQRKTKYLQDVMKYSRALKTLGTLQDITKTFDQSDISGKLTYPVGVRPFNSPPSFAELDNQWEKVKEEDFQLVITIKKGTTRRQAMQQIHWVAQRYAKGLEMEAQKDHCTNVHARAKKAALIEGCKKIVSDSQDQSGADELGLERPVPMQLDESWRDQQLEKLYQDVIQQIIKIKDKENAKLAREREEKEKTDLNLQKADPKALMVELMQQIGIGDGMADVDNEDAVKRKCEELVDALTKNVESPGEGLGHNQYQSRRRSNQRPASNQGKSKAQGKGKTPAKGKGKGKSKTKTKGSKAEGKGDWRDSKGGGKARGGKGRS